MAINNHEMKTVPVREDQRIAQDMCVRTNCFRTVETDGVSKHAIPVERACLKISGKDYTFKCLRDFKDDTASIEKEITITID